MIREQFDLKGKVALVVGGRGFLGQRFSSALAEFGASVYSADMSQQSLAAQKDFNANLTTDIIQKTVDVTNPKSVQNLVDEITSETSRIDILVYSVTAKPKDFYQPFTECSLEGWQKVMQAELDGLFLVTQQVGKVMESAQKGSIILVASIYGIVGNDQRIYEGSNLAQLYSGNEEDAPKRIYSHAAYAAAKGGVISMNRFLAAYWGNVGIRVNCISPGGVSHPGENQDFVQRYSDRVPLARKAGTDELSGSLVFLASDASSYVTGHNLVVDGGWTAW